MYKTTATIRQINISKSNLSRNAEDKEKGRNSKGNGFRSELMMSLTDSL